MCSNKYKISIFSTLYLLTKNGSLFSVNLNTRMEENLGLSLDCLKSQTVTAMVGEFVWNRAVSPLIYALTWNGMLAISLSGASTSASSSTGVQSASTTQTLSTTAQPRCSDVSVNWTIFGDKGLKAISSFTVADKVFIFFTSTEILIYNRGSGLVNTLPITNPPLRQILAASQSSQPFPGKKL